VPRRSSRGGELDHIRFAAAGPCWSWTSLQEEYEVKAQEWLKNAIEEIATEINELDVFEAADPATSDDLLHLRKLVVIHRYLEIELRKLEVRRRHPRSSTPGRSTLVA
jgi:hypothetical protein